MRAMRREAFPGSVRWRKLGRCGISPSASWTSAIDRSGSRSTIAQAAPSRQVTPRQADLGSSGRFERTLRESAVLVDRLGQAEAVGRHDPEQQIACVLAQALVLGAVKAVRHRGRNIAHPTQCHPFDELARPRRVVADERVEPITPCSDVRGIGAARRRHGDSRHDLALVHLIVRQLEQRHEQVVEIVSSEQEEAGRWAAQATGEVGGPGARRGEDRLSPVVRLSFQSDGVAFDLGAARLGDWQARQARPLGLRLGGTFGLASRSQGLDRERPYRLEKSVADD